MNLLARYFMAPENERPEFLSQLYSYASAPAPPPAAAALTPCTTMRIHQATLKERTVCAAIVTRAREEVVCGKELKSPASKEHGLCSQHYYRLRRESDDEHRQATEMAKRLKAAMSAKRMHLAIKEQALNRREKLDERLLELKVRDDEVTHKRARLDTEEQHKLAQEYAAKLLRTEAPATELPEIGALSIRDAMQQ